MTPILEVRNLNKIYPDGTHALKNVSFKVQPGEFLVVIGLSGSGKTTLLRCINHLLAPTSGDVFFEGEPLYSINRKIAMIFQQFNLVPRLSAETNVLTGQLHSMSTLKSIFGIFPEEQRSRARKYLNLVGIENKANVRADQLSGGQQQRVAIARALCQDPKIILADEPVASLDPATCHVVMDYLRKVNRELGITIVCNLHFLSLVREYASRVIALRDGQLVYEGTADSINEDWFKQIYGESARDVHVR